MRIYREFSLFSFFSPLFFARKTQRKDGFKYRTGAQQTTHLDWIVRGVDHHPQRHRFEQQRKLLLVDKVSVAELTPGPSRFPISLFVVPFNGVQLLPETDGRGRTCWHIRRLCIK